MKIRNVLILWICIFVCNISFAVFNPQDNLITHWRFDETAGLIGADSVSNIGVELLGLEASDTSQWVDGKFGNAVNFDGRACATPYSDVWTISDLGGFQEKTVSMWVKFNDISSVQYLFCNNWGGYKATLLNYDGQLRMQYDDKNGIVGDKRVSGVFQTEQWYHVILLSRNTEDGLSTMEAWVNGVMITSMAGLVRDETGLVDNLGIGTNNAQNPDSSQFIKGMLDDMRFYDVALSQEQIEALYDYEPSTDSLEDSLLVYMPMDDGLTVWAYDEKGTMGGEVKGFSGIESAWNNHGKFGRCFNGDGNENRIALASVPDTYATTALGKFQNNTISAWVCPTGATSPVGNTVQFIFGLINGSDQPYKFYLAMVNGYFRVQGTEGYQQYQIPVIDGNTWYHLAVVNANTADGMSEFRLYVNGTLAVTKTGITRDEVGKHYYPSIGGSAADKSMTAVQRQAFYGKIDDFRIYNATLTDTEVADLAATVPAERVFRTKDDLELYYEMDQEGGSDLIADSSGNDLYGVMNNYDGNTSQWVNGVYGKCFDFDGISNSITFKDRNNEFAFGPFKDKTISCWINPDDTSGLQQIFNIAPQTGGYKYYLYLYGSLVRLQGVSTTEGNEIIQTVGQVTPGEWTHVAAVIRECTEASVCCEVYINGIQDGFKKLYKNSDMTRAYALTIGATLGFDTTNANSWFDGTIDDFRIYDKDLSPSDVNDIYNGGPIVFGDVDQDSDVDGDDLDQFAGSWIDSTIEQPSTVTDFEKGTFEYYADQAALDTYWSDFGQSASIGSTAMSTATLLSTSAESYSGSKALRWQYNTNDFSGNGARFTDILFELDTPVDVSGYDYLSLWVKRASGNAKQTGMYVKFLNGGVAFDNVAATSIVTYEQGSTSEPADQWDNWLVDLDRLLYTSYAPVELDNVQGLVLGCYALSGYEGTGTIDIDNIELITAPVCSGFINADLNDDCQVDLYDYSILADEWMGY
ncbi:MAG: LamG domain-containing protein [Sedimentisphaeraceae bacterium JB056]